MRGGCSDCNNVCGGTKLTEFVEWEKAYDDTRVLYADALEGYNRILAMPPEQQRENQVGLESAIRFFETFRDIEKEFMKSYKALNKQQQKEYQKRSSKIPEAKPKPLQPLPPIPEVEERPGMNRQDAVGMGKKIAFARKYLRGKGIRASTKNVDSLLNTLDVEGVVFAD